MARSKSLLAAVTPNLSDLAISFDTLPTFELFKMQKNKAVGTHPQPQLLKLLLEGRQLWEQIALGTLSTGSS